MSGFVYFIAPEAVLHRPEHDPCRVVKIGFTASHPRQRLRTLQTGSPAPLVLWAFTPGSEALEGAFHETFAELQSHGEWFFVEDKLRLLLSMLGDEPNIGNLIQPQQMGVAIRDALVSDSAEIVPDDRGLWEISAYPEPLRRFFPEAFL